MRKSMKRTISNVVFTLLLYQIEASHVKVENAKRSRNIFETRIVGGEQSEPGEFPFFVDCKGCGGILIAPGVVLSAAHCFPEFVSEVIVGAYEFGQETYGAVEVNVADYESHPQYDDESLDNDFALYRLEKEVNIKTDITLLVNSEYKVPSVGQPVTVIGMGMLYEEGPADNYLRDVEVLAIDEKVCNGRKGYGGLVNDDVMFCAGVEGGGQDACSGDSGGPLILKSGNIHLLVGIVSWGYGCAQAEYPGVYARVSSSYNWIKTTVCDDWRMNAAFCSGGLAPTQAPDPTPAPTPLTCSNDEMKFDFTFNTDNFGDESRWTLRNINKVVLRGNNFDSNSSYQTIKCIPKDCYTLTIFDSFGDGLSEGDSNTGYRLVIDGKVEQEGGGDNFGRSIGFTFGCNTPTLPPAVAPSSPPSSTGSSSCNQRVHISLALTIGSLLWFTMIGE